MLEEEVKMESEEKEEDLSVSVVCPKNYEEPESCGSAANFLLGVAMEGDSSDILLEEEAEMESEEKEGPLQS